MEKTGLIIKKKSKTFSDPSLNNSSKHYIPLKYRDPKLKSAQEKFLYNNDLMGFMFYSTFYQAILDCGYNNETVLRKKPLEIADIKTHTNIYNSFDQAINNKMIQVFFLIRLFKYLFQGLSFFDKFCY